MIKVFSAFTPFPSVLSQVFNGMSMGDLKTFITEQEKLAIRPELEMGDSPVVGEFGDILNGSSNGKQNQENGKNGVRGYIV